MRPYPPPTATQRKLDRLIRRRAPIVRLKNTLKLTMRDLGGFAAELKAVMEKLEALIAKIDATLSALVTGSPHNQETQRGLETYCGSWSLGGHQFDQYVGARAISQGG